LSKVGRGIGEMFPDKSQSLKDTLLQSQVSQASEAAQNHVRGMLKVMIESVPGQLMRDIERFHLKFMVLPEAVGHVPDTERLEFRIKFMLEELFEYCQAMGVKVKVSDHKVVLEKMEQPEGPDIAGAFDALIDLTYVVLGTAYMQNFPFNAGWDRVHAANMAKVRSKSDDDPLSKRKSKWDIVKLAAEAAVFGRTD
jgi:predicted HAD superfamily Cof-like phosphohydrolase